MNLRSRDRSSRTLGDNSGNIFFYQFCLTISSYNFTYGQPEKLETRPWDSCRAAIDVMGIAMKGVSPNPRDQAAKRRKLAIPALIEYFGGNESSDRKGLATMAAESCRKEEG